MLTGKMSLLACALALCLSDSTLAQQNISAQSISVRSMYDDCKGRNLEYCDGFLLAIAQGLEMLSTYHPRFSSTGQTTANFGKRIHSTEWLLRSG
jgi:hypothetical protein